MTERKVNRMIKLHKEMKATADQIKAKMLRNESTIVLREKFRKLQRQHQALWNEFQGVNL